MKNSLTILGAALIIAVSIIIGITWRPSGGITDDSQNRREIIRISQVREKAVNVIDVHVSDIKQVLLAIDETLSSTNSRHEDIAGHADEIGELTQMVRLSTTDLKYEDSRVLKLLLDRLQHLAHELEHAGETKDHEEAHHVYKNMLVEVENLVREVTIVRANL